MAIYSRPVRALMKDMANELAPTPESVFSKQQAVSWFAKHYPKIKTGTVTAHLIRLSTNATSRTHYSTKPGQDDVFYQLDRSRFRLYQPTQDPQPIYTRRANSGLKRTRRRALRAWALGSSRMKQTFETIWQTTCPRSSLDCGYTKTKA